MPLPLRVGGSDWARCEVAAATTLVDSYRTVRADQSRDRLIPTRNPIAHTGLCEADPLPERYYEGLHRCLHTVGLAARQSSPTGA